MNNDTRGGTNEFKELLIKLVIAVLIIGGALAAAYALTSSGILGGLPFEVTLILTALVIFAIIFCAALVILVVSRRRGSARPERMSDFFATRVEGYDEHITKNVEGYTEACARIGGLLPEGTRRILDLGCGTGLELSSVFEVAPSAEVLGIDLCCEMTNQLKERYPCHNIRILNTDFRDARLPSEHFDAVISAEALHHLTEGEKARLYSEIYGSLRTGGRFILCDYVAMGDAEAAEMRKEYDEKFRKYRLSSDTAYHIDIPMTVADEIKLMKSAGFFAVTQEFCKGHTAIISARKE